MTAPRDHITAHSGGQTAFESGEPAAAPDFDYEAAFSRNIGWVTPAEQQILRDKRVAVAGLGGVGGSHVLTLARLGVGGFHIADFDRFELANLNRQAGAAMDTLDREKGAVIQEMARAINPELDLHRRSEAITDEAQAAAFLEGCDLVIDGLDFFVLEARRALFAAAEKAGIPAITAAPLGTGTAWLVFLPGGMRFDDYFAFRDGEPIERRYVKFMVGLAPKALHRSTLVAPERVNFADKAGPSTAMGCQMASAVASSEALKVLLGRPGLRPAPAFQQFDPARGRFATGRHRGGNRHPLRRGQIALAERWIERIAPKRDPLADSVAPDAPVLDKILDLARWAPSGDNGQPWRFERLGPERVRVHLKFSDEGNVYEYAGGRPVWLSAGALLESLRLAASQFARHCYWELAPDSDRAIDVSFFPGPGVRPERLARFLKHRSVDRRAYRRDPLEPASKAALEAAWGEAFEVRWLESLSERWAATRLNMAATHIRLRIPECHRVHQEVIRFGDAYAEEGMPADSVGLDPLTTRLMGWANARWWRTKLLNRWLGGARLASLQLDVVAGLACGAHFAIRWRDGTRGKTVEDWLEAGAAMQRFWLEATAQNLVLQPSFAPIIFAHYAETGQDDWALPQTAKEARGVATRLRNVWDCGPDPIVFTGRIGRASAPPKARSLRRSLSGLTQ